MSWFGPVGHSLNLKALAPGHVEADELINALTPTLILPWPIAPLLDPTSQRRIHEGKQITRMRYILLPLVQSPPSPWRSIHMAKISSRESSRKSNLIFLL